MIAVYGGLIAASCWGISTNLAGASARQIGPASTLAWVGIAGVVLMTPIVGWYGIPEGVTWWDGLLVLVGAVGSVVGLRLTYAALARGKVGVVVAITSTEGAIAAVIAFVLGESIGWTAALGIVLATLGVAAVGLGRHVDDSHEMVRDNRRAGVTATGAALIFGSSLYVSGDVAQRVGPPWVVFGARLLGVLIIAIPLLLRRQLQVARPGIYLACIAGLLECAGFLGFLWGASAGIAVAAVLATQYATIATLISWIVLRERLSHVQLGGIATVVVGVMVLSVSSSI